MIFFALAKILFLLYHLRLTRTLTFSEIGGVFLYGARMDASFTAYLCIFPFLLFWAATIFPRIPAQRILNVYSRIFIIIISFLLIADLELYNAWGFRMDITPVLYLASPKEVAGTVTAAPLLLLGIVLIIFIILTLFIYKKCTRRIIQAPSGHFSLVRSLVALLLISFLFIPIRGGIQKIPMNISDVYFSQKIYANHAAINLPWNILFTALNRDNARNPFDYFTENESGQLVKTLYDTGPKKIPFILSAEKPNIILFILESNTAKWYGCLGGAPGVTPCLDSIAADGLLFTNIYAAGDRSEKGQVAILSGYPNQAINSIIKKPEKTRQLPSLNKALAQAGYHSSYTYGGELEFANIKSYLINIGMEKITGKYQFPVSQRTTSWGVHDEYTFSYFFDFLQKEPQPFFATLFSLSSHEPYDVPLKHFKGNDETTLFKNAVYYTDSVAGDFIRKLKQTPLWKNTLVIFTADHGHPLPNHDANDRPSKFHIPLIFTGGALQLKGRIAAIGSQTDIATTLLDQLRLPAADFKWGKDLLDSAATPFAFYSFNNGFGFVTPAGAATVDNVSGKIIYADPGYDTTRLAYGKAYMQFSYQDYLNR